jgi:hypothetical protein
MFHFSFAFLAPIWIAAFNFRGAKVECHGGGSSALLWSAEDRLNRIGILKTTSEGQSRIVRRFAADSG